MLLIEDDFVGGEHNYLARTNFGLIERLTKEMS